MAEKNKVPVFGSWRGWYIAVLVIHFLAIGVYYLITTTFTPQ